MNDNENLMELTAKQWRPHGKWTLLNCYTSLAWRIWFRKSNITKVVLCKARQAPLFLVHAADREGTAANKKSSGTYCSAVTCPQKRPMHLSAPCSTGWVFMRNVILCRWPSDQKRLKRRGGFWHFSLAAVTGHVISILVHNTYITNWDQWV